MMESIGFKYFDYKDLHKVPESPGLYCWYARRKIAEYDWKNLSSEEFVNMISDDFARYSSPSLDTTVRSFFGMEWSAKNQSVALDKWIKTFKNKTLSSAEFNDDGEEDINGQFFLTRSFFDSQVNRQFYSQVNDFLSPIYESPLYIGKSKNLKHRLEAHKISIDNCSAVCDGYDLSLVEEGRSFGERLIGAGFSAEELRVYILDFEELSKKNELNLNADELNKMATIFEYMMIRMVRPILGRV